MQIQLLSLACPRPPLHTQWAMQKAEVRVVTCWCSSWNRHWVGELQRAHHMAWPRRPICGAVGAKNQGLTV